MFSAKQHMKKYFLLILMVFSTLSFAQFQDNVFENEKRDAQQKPNSSSTESEDGPPQRDTQPGGPGEPVPIDDYIPWLLFAGMSIIIYSQRENKKVNI